LCSSWHSPPFWLPPGCCWLRHAPIAQITGLAAKQKAFFAAPLADYRIALPGAAWIGKAAAGLTGLVLAAAACVGLARWFSRWRSV